MLSGFPRRWCGVLAPGLLNADAARGSNSAQFTPMKPK